MHARYVVAHKGPDKWIIKDRHAGTELPYEYSDHRAVFDDVKRINEGQPLAGDAIQPPVKDEPQRKNGDVKPMSEETTQVKRRTRGGTQGRPFPGAMRVGKPPAVISGKETKHKWRVEKVPLNTPIGEIKGIRVNPRNDASGKRGTRIYFRWKGVWWWIPKKAASNGNGSAKRVLGTWKCLIEDCDSSGKTTSGSTALRASAYNHVRKMHGIRHPTVGEHYRIKMVGGKAEVKMEQEEPEVKTETKTRPKAGNVKQVVELVQTLSEWTGDDIDIVRQLREMDEDDFETIVLLSRNMG
jgi:hypothetical protein